MVVLSVTSQLICSHSVNRSAALLCMANQYCSYMPFDFIVLTLQEFL